MKEREELARRRRVLLDELASVEGQLAEEDPNVRQDGGAEPPWTDEVWCAEVGAAREYICILDREGRLLYVNHPQPGSEDYYGRSIFDFVAPEYQAALRRAWQRYDETGLPQHYELTGTGTGDEPATYTSWFCGLVQNGRLAGYVVQSMDVTEQRRMEEDLEEHQMRFASLIAHAPDSILIVDREHRLVFINRTSADFPEERLLGSPIEEILRAEDRDTVREQIESVFQTGEHTSFEVVVPGSREEHWFSVRTGPILRGTEVVQVTLIATDITERRRAEAESRDLGEQLHQAQKMEAIGQLTGGIAHDFNNLLTVILGNLELVELEDAVSPAVLDLTQQSANGARKASTLTQRLLAFSRKQALQPRRIDLGRFLEGMGDILRRVLGETIDVTIRHPSETWLCHLDPTQIENVILNLAINARDAMPAGGSLELSVENVTLDGSRPGMDAGDCLQFVARDNGHGMSTEVQERVYEPFFTTKDVGKGSGLGLSMIYGFVSQSGGVMSIKSIEGQGTSVEILLPRADPDGSTTPVPRTVGEHVGAGEQVLVVEDDEAVRGLTVAMLKRLGYRTLEARDVAEALRLLSTAPEIQLILTDVVLPGGRSGFDLAREAAALHPHLRTVLCSGYAQDAATHAGVATDGMQLLEKPYSRGELARAVRDALDMEPLRTAERDAENGALGA